MVENVRLEEHTESRMDPELEKLELSLAGARQLESPSVGTGIDAPGQQCLSNWEMEQTSTVNGCVLVSVSSNFRKTFFPGRTRYRDTNR